MCRMKGPSLVSIWVLMFTANLKINKWLSVFGSVSHTGPHLLPVKKCALQLSVWPSQSHQSFVLKYTFHFVFPFCKKKKK